MPERPVFRLRRKRQRKIPVKLQMNQYDCGPSCLHMLLAYHGYEADFTDLRERFAMLGNGRDGSSMLKMKEVAKTYHLKGIAKKRLLNHLTMIFCQSFVSGRTIILSCLSGSRRVGTSLLLIRLWEGWLSVRRSLRRNIQVFFARISG